MFLEYCICFTASCIGCIFTSFGYLLFFSADEGTRTRKTCLLTNNSNTVCFLYNFPLSLQTGLNFNDILNSLDFDMCFYKNKRYTAFFGNTQYSYSGVTHCPVPIESNIHMLNALQFINKLFPEITVNSILVNYYPELFSNLPFHSDDEPAILADSYILTLSFGSSREIAFRKRDTCSEVARFSLDDRKLLIFSKSSQFIFQHSILLIGQGVEPATTRGRISLTFRHVE